MTSKKGADKDKGKRKTLRLKKETLADLKVPESTGRKVKGGLSPKLQ